MFSFLKNLFRKKETVVTEEQSPLVYTEIHREVAKVVPLFNKNAEEEELLSSHPEFFSEEPIPALQMQSQVGKRGVNHILANIADVNPSRSTLFFRKAPSIGVHKNNDPILEKEILELEDYLGIPVYEGEEDLEYISNETKNESSY